MPEELVPVPASSAPLRLSDKRGLECPKCGCRHLPVFYTRRVGGGRIMRSRECRHCGRRVVTYETAIG
jgi:DNA-directed RNA polymerase subunit RPC12/RpoP